MAPCYLLAWKLAERKEVVAVVRVVCSQKHPRQLAPCRPVASYPPSLQTYPFPAPTPALPHPLLSGLHWGLDPSAALGGRPRRSSFSSSTKLQVHVTTRLPLDA
eukprot:comp22218_c0_seq1/m.32722 comp22218_c0_seq1/g.32722  ORF comp22218_c0_seq1/g.32722 comp22218_c0_seq1/m.32722 type:complete len:104 (+) comp22218_c0_seq1:3587-3898(+)